jgi:hypothetical protein
VSALVPCELLPHGLCWSPFGYDFRSETSYCLDVRLDVSSREIGFLERCMHISHHSDLINEELAQHAMALAVLFRYNTRPVDTVREAALSSL